MEDPQFTGLLKDRWSELRSNAVSLGELNWMVDMAAGRLRNNEAAKRNYYKWDQQIGIDWESSIQELKSYLEERVLWMDGEISAL